MTTNNKFFSKSGRLNRILATLREDEDVGTLIIEKRPPDNPQKKNNAVKKKQLSRSKKKTYKN